MQSLKAQALPQRAKLGKLLRLQDEVVRRTVVTPEDYLLKKHPEDVVDDSISALDKHAHQTDY